MARPRKYIDELDVADLAMKGHSIAGLARSQEVSVDTLRRRAREVEDLAWALKISKFQRGVRRVLRMYQTGG